MGRNIVERWIFRSMVAVMCAAPAAALSSDRVPISSARVVAALSDAGVETTAAQVEFLSAVGSAQESTNLKLVSLSKWNNDSMKAHLRCTNNAECLPFYVVLHHLNADNISPRTFESATNEKKRPAKKLGERVIRGGQSATMIYEAKDMKIVVPIVCLQNGRRGERIRVASPDRKKFYMAEVIDSGLVKGIL